MKKRDIYGANYRIKKMVSMSILLDYIHKNTSRIHRYSLNAMLYKSLFEQIIWAIFYVFSM